MPMWLPPPPRSRMTRPHWSNGPGQPHDASIVAPFDGYIATISGNPGMWTGGGAVASGTATATQFEIIMTSTQLEIDAYVNEADISKVSVGQPVTFTVDTYPNQTFTGKIIALSPNATTVSNVQEYEAIMSIDNYSKLKSGMPATITIITASANNVLVVPQTAFAYSSVHMASAMAKGGAKPTAASLEGVPAGGITPGDTWAGERLIPGSTSTSQSTGVVVVLVNGKPQIRRVETGLSDDVNVEIKSGLSEGDIVIASDQTTESSSTSSSGSSSSTKSSEYQGGAEGNLQACFNFA